MPINIHVTCCSIALKVEKHFYEMRKKIAYKKLKITRLHSSVSVFSRNREWFFRRFKRRFRHNLCNLFITKKPEDKMAKKSVWLIKHLINVQWVVLLGDLENIKGCLQRVDFLNWLKLDEKKYHTTIVYKIAAH